MKFEPTQIEFIANQIGLIDSGEKGVFLETVNTDKQIDAHIFHENEVSGVYFSCTIFDGVRISIVFNDDADTYNADLAALVESTLQKAASSSCLICVWNKNRKIIEFLKEKFKIQPYSGTHYYASIEFIMKRVNFNIPSDNNPLDARPYEEKHIDKYVMLLDSAMNFGSEPPNYMENKEEYATKFEKLAEDNSFESFWKDGELVGLYWRKNAEIDMMAVANNHQRKGYGTIILTRAIKMAFKNTTNDFAYLYTVDWNTKGQSFYRKYGMEENGHSYLLYLKNYTA